MAMRLIMCDTINKNNYNNKKMILNISYTNVVILILGVTR